MNHNWFAKLDFGGLPSNWVCVAVTHETYWRFVGVAAFFAHGAVNSSQDLYLGLNLEDWHSSQQCSSENTKNRDSYLKFINLDTKTFHK